MMAGLSVGDDGGDRRESRGVDGPVEVAHALHSEAVERGTQDGRERDRNERGKAQVKMGKAKKKRLERLVREGRRRDESFGAGGSEAGGVLANDDVAAGGGGGGGMQFAEGQKVWECNVCCSRYVSRNKLFAHIKDTGHALHVDSGSGARGGGRRRA